jgi:hypothetical protein
MNENGELMHEVEPDPYQEDRVAFWQSVGKDFVRESHPAVDESTRQILQVNGMLISLYAAVFAFSDLLALDLTTVHKIVFLAPLGFFLVSLVLALSVFFLDKGQIHLHSHTGIRSFYQETLEKKLNTMKASAVCLSLGVAGMLVAAGLILFGL